MTSHTIDCIGIGTIIPDVIQLQELGQVLTPPLVRIIEFFIVLRY